MSSDLLERLESFSRQQLDDIIDELGIYSTEDSEDESISDKIGMILAWQSEVSPQEFQKIIETRESS